MTPDPKSFTSCYAVILAGGSGTRFWPESRHETPKQLCHIASDTLTMIEQTIDRIANYIPAERRIIVTHKDQYDQTLEIVKDKVSRIIAEPEAKNTAAALGLAARFIEQHSSDTGIQDPVMLSLHADHVVPNPADFIADVCKALPTAQSGLLTLLGIEPSYPATGYGYIQKGEKTLHDSYRVKSFKEKPATATAQQYLLAGDQYLWNSGLFLWKNQVFQNELKEFVPAIVDELSKIDILNSKKDELESQLSPVYKSFEKLAIDNAVLEQSKNIAVMPVSFKWFDVGSWDSLPDAFGTDSNGNFSQGNVFIENTQNSTIVSGENHFVAVIGMNDVVVTTCRGGTFVSPKGQSENVKKVVQYLKDNELNKFT